MERKYLFRVFTVPAGVEVSVGGFNLDASTREPHARPDGRFIFGENDHIELTVESGGQRVDVNRNELDQVVDRGTVVTKQLGTGPPTLHVCADGQVYRRGNNYVHVKGRRETILGTHAGRIVVHVSRLIETQAGVLYRNQPHESRRHECWWHEHRVAGGGGARCIAHPSRMRGDLWHIILAMRMDPGLRLDCVSRSGGHGEVKHDQEQRLALIGLSAHVLNRTTAELTHHQRGRIFTHRKPQTADVSFVDALNHVRGLGLNHTVGSTICSTSIINYATAAMGIERARKQVRSCLTRPLKAVAAPGSGEAAPDPSIDCVRVARSIDEHFDRKHDDDRKSPHELFSSARKLLFVNMRAAGAGQNTIHNITESIFQLIVERCERKGIRVVRIGCPEHEKESEYGWVNDQFGDTTIMQDIYGVGPHKVEGLKQAMHRDKRLQPFFWARMQQYCKDHLKQVVGFIGGRSGGMDIASWVGVRCASYDQVNVNNEHYMRLHWASPWMSIIANQGGAGLDKDALDHWLDGNDIVPVLPGDPAGPGDDAVVDNTLAADAAVQRLAFLPRADEGRSI